MRNEDMIREWFRDHVAEYKKINDRIRVLDWKKPNRRTYYIRYVFDGKKMYVSGDLGEAVFNLTWHGNPFSFDDVNIHYFHEKLSAFYKDKYCFNRKRAQESLSEEIERLSTGFGANEIEDEHFEVLEELKKVADDCTNVNEWEIKITYETDLFDRLQKHDSSCWEWIYEVGNEYPITVRAYLVGLKMATEQLTVEGV